MTLCQRERGDGALGHIKSKSSLGKGELFVGNLAVIGCMRVIVHHVEPIGRTGGR